MNDRQICFIIAGSDVLYQEECRTYLRALAVPDGYITDIITVEGAISLCAAYQAAMQASEAKYKIYVKAGLFLQYKELLFRLLELFADQTLGMIGMAGARELSGDGVLENSDLVYPAEETQDVAAITGVFAATQIDLPWREELFQGDDFAVTAQSLEYRRAGYRVAVLPCYGEAMYFHDDPAPGAVDEEDRERFLREYGDWIHGDHVKKRILCPDMGLVSTWNIPYGLTMNNVEVVYFCYTGTPEHRTNREIDQVSETIRRLHVDAVMTHDYYVPIAMACGENDIPYIAWIYDSIQVALYDDSIRLSNNYIFDFDRLQARETKERGAPYVRHMSLAANPYLADALELGEEDVKRFACDISFIGSLYADDDFLIPMGKLDDGVAAEIRRLLEQRIGLWDGETRFAGRLSDAAIRELAVKALQGTGYDRKLIGDRRYIEETFFSRGITHLERVEALRRLGATGADVRLYTHEEGRNTKIPGVKVERALNYSTELPKAYYLSRINLNLTLPSIRSGVPLRVFDVLSSGGFLLTNDQPEMGELFEIGHELEVFRSFEEMTDKVDYYLHHEKERLQIALNGHRKVRECYSYDKQVGGILDMVTEDLVSKGKRGLK